MGCLRSCLCLLQPSQVGIYPGEVLIDRFHSDQIICLSHAIAVGLGQLIHHRLRRNLLIRRSRSLRFATQASGFAALIQKELYESTSQTQRYEIEFLPHLVELFLTCFVENKLIKRFVVPKVSHHIVETCTEVTSGVSRVVGEVSTTFGHIERIRKDRGESLKRCLVALTLARGHLQFRIRTGSHL